MGGAHHRFPHAAFHHFAVADHHAHLPGRLIQLAGQCHAHRHRQAVPQRSGADLHPGHAVFVDVHAQRGVHQVEALQFVQREEPLRAMADESPILPCPLLRMKGSRSGHWGCGDPGAGRERRVRPVSLPWRGCRRRARPRRSPWLCGSHPGGIHCNFL